MKVIGNKRKNKERLEVIFRVVPGRGFMHNLEEKEVKLITEKIEEVGL